MKSTMVVGFVGLFLVGGFLTGLYLINKPTNPPTSASEIVNPVDQPPESETQIPSPSIAEVQYSLEKCQPLYGKSSDDADFDSDCDLDKNGMINVVDLQKMEQ